LSDEQTVNSIPSWGAIKVLPYQALWIRDDNQLKICVKGRQIGMSWAATLRAVLKCNERKTDWLFLSTGERQSKRLMDKVRDHLRMFKIAAEYYQLQIPETFGTQHEIRFPNGSVITGLPANAETARGYSANVTLDEFAFHVDAEKIYRALYPSITRGFGLEIISTPNGPQGKFYDLAKEAGLVDGRIRNQKWSGHKTSLDDAIAAGFRVDREALRAGLDEDAWLQEFFCQFVSTDAQWIPPELFEANVDLAASTSYPRIEDHQPGSLYAGWDIARTTDFSVLWFLEPVGDVTWTRGVITWRNVSTPNQIRDVRALMPIIRRLSIDQTGMGLVIAETLQHEFGSYKVEGVQFTSAVKEKLATHLKGRMEQHLCRLPENDVIRNSFRAIKKTTNILGQARFDTERSALTAHGDHFWSACLAEAAADNRAKQYGLLQWFSNVKSGLWKLPEPPTPADMQREEQQIRALQGKPAPQARGGECPKCGPGFMQKIPGNLHRCARCGEQYGVGRTIYGDGYAPTRY
jgi:phage FluMu gp28-like protein